MIIPVYNGEKYIHRCLESVVNQTYKNIEIIIINDGSIDNSQNILDEFANTDQRIKLVHQSNTGVSKARNNGIDLANGDYFQFVDIDDYLELDTVEQLVKNINDYNADIVVFGHNKVGQKHAKENLNKSNQFILHSFTRAEYLDNFFLYYFDQYYFYIGDKIFSSKIVKEHDIKFHESIGWDEDLIFVCEFLNRCGNVVVNSKPFYNYYRLNTGSITSKYQPKLFEWKKKSFSVLKSLLIENEVYHKKNVNAFVRAHFKQMVMCVNHLFHKDANLRVAELKDKVSEVIDYIIEQNYSSDLEYHSFDEKIMGYLLHQKRITSIVLYISVKKIIKNTGLL